MPLLHWLTRDQDIQTAAKVPHRILQEVPELSYGEPSQNLLVQGDNLEALKALLPFYAGRVKCIFIDPPYNTGSAFAQYDDALEHSKWLSVIFPRLQILRDLLGEDGSIWITIDDNEAHYLKVVCDEVFGRANFVTNIIWAKRSSPANDAKYFSTDHDNILVFAKSLTTWKLNRLPRSEKHNTFYKNPDNDARGPWNSVTYTGNKNKTERPNLYYAIKQPNTGEEIFPPDGLTWRYGQDTHYSNELQNKLYWGKDGKSRIPRMKMFLSEAGLVVPRTIWASDEVGSTQISMNEQKVLSEVPFATPKPEQLLQRILTIATNPGDLVLDSFLGSGTTAAVAHKMGRRWIGVEMGDHAKTHCATRLHKVIDGEQGGISKDVDWKGGGGFRFCTLGPTIFDEQGRINPEIKFPELARHLWFVETKTPMASETVGTIIGSTEKMAYALLYNGILKDRTPNGGNVLTSGTLKIIREDLEKAHPGFEGEVVVYAAASRIGPDRLRDEGIIFKQTPYDISARG